MCQERMMTMKYMYDPQNRINAKSCNLLYRFKMLIILFVLFDLLVINTADNIYSQELIIGWTMTDYTNISHFRLFRKTGEDVEFTFIDTVRYPKEEYFDQNIQFNQHYYYAATAVDIYGNESEFSNIIDTVLINPDVDTAPPYLTHMYPQDDATKVLPDTLISFQVSDEGTGVNINSLCITLNSDTIFCGEERSQLHKTTIRGDSMAYQVTVRPLNSFGYGQSIDVSVKVSDLSQPANFMEESWSFDTVRDTMPPYITELQPSIGATDVPVDTTIVIHFRDEESGVDISSIQLIIDDKLVYDGKKPGDYPFTTVSGDSTDYKLIYVPSEMFSYNALIKVETIAADLAVPPNQMPKQTYVFTTETETSVTSNIMNIPETFKLYQNFPNPFNPLTVIQYDLPKRSDIELIVYDMAGRYVTTLVKGTQKAGRYRYFWSGTDFNNRSVASGIYFCKMKASQYRKTLKVLKVE